MPISSKVLMPRSAEAGKIKIGQVGAKKKSVKGREFNPPEKLESKEGPYFVVTKTLRGTGDNVNFVRDNAIMQALEKCAELDSDGVRRIRQIPIMIDSDMIDEIAPHRLALYRGTNLFCTGTGEGKGSATRYEGNVPRPFDCPCELLRAREGEKCKPNLILWCTIIAGAETKLGVRHAFRTTGWNSIKSIIYSLETIQKQVGTICGIKLWLCVKWDLKKDGAGTTRRVPVVHIECRTNDLMGLRREAIASARTRLEVIQLQNPAVLALPSPGQNESKPVQAEVAAEWYPRRDAEPDPEDEDEELYDPESGEVIDDPSEEQEPPSRRGTEPGMPAVEPTIYGTDNLDEIWLPTHAAQKRMAQLLRAVAKLRDMPEPEGKPAMKDVLAEVTTRVLDKAIVFNMLTLRQAMKVDDALVAEIQRRTNEDDADGIPE
jgi:hypothetical protein